jgi:hypothetical protein
VQRRTIGWVNLAEERRVVKMSASNQTDESPVPSKPWHEMTYAEFAAEAARLYGDSASKDITRDQKVCAQSSEGAHAELGPAPVASS